MACTLCIDLKHAKTLNKLFSPDHVSYLSEIRGNHINNNNEITTNTSVEQREWRRLPKIYHGAD